MKLKANKILKDLMKSYFTDLGQAAKDPTQKVAWCTSVGPAELLRAFNYKVYFPENHGALLGVTRKASDLIPMATSRGYSSKICSYLTSDIGSFLAKKSPLLDAYGLEGPPKPDLLVVNDNQCREVEEWFGFYAREFNVPLLVLRTPKFLDTIEEHHLDYLQREMLELVNDLESINGHKVNRELLVETVRQSARATEYWKQVLATARNKPAPISFFDSTIHMGPIVLMRGMPECVAYYKLLLEELQDVVKQGLGAVPGETRRLYWDGMPVWGKLRSLSDVFASLDTTVVASTYCNSWVFDSFDGDDPIRSVALAYAEIFINRSESQKENYLVRLCKEYDVEGIVYHDAMTCPYNSNCHFGLPERVQARNNLPFIVLDGDLNDLRCFSEEQSITKIETFVEQLAQ